MTSRDYSSAARHSYSVLSNNNSVLAGAKHDSDRAGIDASHRVPKHKKRTKAKDKRQHSMSYNGTININFIGWRRFLAMGFLFISFSLSHSPCFRRVHPEKYYNFYALFGRKAKNGDEKRKSSLPF